MAKDKVSFGTIFKDLSISLDSGGSLSISPLRSDFIGIIKPICVQIQGLLASARIEGVGRVRRILLDFANNVCSIET